MSSVRDLCQTDIYKKIEKMVSLVCPFKLNFESINLSQLSFFYKKDEDPDPQK